MAHRKRLVVAGFALVSALLALACGPIPPPVNAYTQAPMILKDLEARRDGIKSFRIMGRVDHFGKKHRVQGKTFLFSILPKKLRIELVSPFGNPLNVLTINEEAFVIHDMREGKYLTGKPEPCNIARFVQIPMPVEDVVRILIGDTPLIEGNASVVWDRNEGLYRVTITDGVRTQRVEIGKEHDTLPLLRSTMEDAEGVVFDITYKRWQPVSGFRLPHEIRVKMPREEADLLVRYDSGGVELNVVLPPDAWSQTPPPGLEPEVVTCE